MIAKTKVKCPKCKSNNLFLIEIWKGSTATWEQEDGEINREDANLNSGNADPFKVEAICKKCNHGWTIRKAMNIDDTIS